MQPSLGVRINENLFIKKEFVHQLFFYHALKQQIVAPICVSVNPLSLFIKKNNNSVSINQIDAENQEMLLMHFLRRSWSFTCHAITYIESPVQYRNLLITIQY